MHPQLLAVGYDHSCHVVDGGVVECWGFGVLGAVGDGTFLNRSTPTVVNGLSGVVQLSAGGHHTCARTASGHVWCWGGNAGGAVWPGLGPSVGSPFMIPEVDDAIWVSAGLQNTCVVRSDGTVWCWGDLPVPGADGWDGGKQSSHPIARVPGIEHAIAVSVDLDFACALLEDSTVRCWGVDAWGRLGGGDALGGGSLIPSRP
ncbi:MAG: hypothetical protein IRZ16_19145 [Myxococcaceae bacterium]|nr:hypothetical protein [Myxococcaceae bacterium]